MVTHLAFREDGVSPNGSLSWNAQFLISVFCNAVPIGVVGEGFWVLKGRREDSHSSLLQMKEHHNLKYCQNQTQARSRACHPMVNRILVPNMKEKVVFQGACPQLASPVATAHEKESRTVMPQKDFLCRTMREANLKKSPLVCAVLTIIFSRHGF